MAATALTVRPSGRLTVPLLTFLLAFPGSLTAQIVPFSAGGVDVTPDGGTDPGRTPNSDYYTSFTVTNSGIFQYTFTLTCGRTGAVTSCESDVDQITLGAGASGNVVVQYSTGSAGSGTVTLTASRTGASDQGSINVTVLVESAPSVALRNHNREAQDRSLCLTTGGAGEAAAVGCGHLVITHSTPGYATLGKTRVMTLLYNSAQASPGAVVPITVTQLANKAKPVSVFVKLLVNGTQRDSATYNSSTWGGGTSNQARQTVLWFADTSLATGIYPVSVEAKNNYVGSSLSATVYDTLIVVNRVKDNRFGAGWSLVGVERLHLNQPTGTTHILWVGGDGSAKWYRQKAGDNTRWIAPAGGYRDTLVLAGGQYTRTLRHGIQVVFDAQGRHVRTVNRTGHSTVFTWNGDSLLTVRVPPGGVSGTTYTLAYDGNKKLDRITDPANRVLDVTVTANRLRSIVDPDTSVGTHFAYDSTGPITTLLRTRRTRRGFTTWFTHQGPLLIRDSVPHDTTVTTHAITAFAPWNAVGWNAHPHSSQQTAVDTAAVYTLVSGPRVGVPDDARFWVDKWGAPVKIVGAISDTTKIFRGSTATPAMVTKVVRPDGVMDSLTYDARGNLVKDSTAYGGGAPPVVSRWTYASPNTKDAPDSAMSPVDTTLYAYNSWGLTERVRTQNGHVTRFAYRPVAGDSLQGLIAQVSDSLVKVYSTVAGNETLYQMLNTGFAFNARGNIVADSSPMGRVRQLFRGFAERVDSMIDPGGHVTSFSYDTVGRVRQQRVHRAGAGDTTRYTWRLGTLEQVADPRGVLRKYRYDPMGRTIGEMDDYDALEVRYYGLAGQLDSLQRRSGHMTRWYYDSAGRTTKMSWPARDTTGGSIPGDTTRYSYDIMGRMLSASTVLRDTVDRTYHLTGLLKTEVSRRGGRYSTAYEYDAGGRRTMLWIGNPGDATNSDSVYYRYNNKGELATIAVRWRGVTPIRDSVQFLWTPLGRRDSLLYSNGIGVKFVYDADGTMRLLCSNGPDPSGSGVFDFKSHVDAVTSDGMASVINATAPSRCTQGTPLPFNLDTLQLDEKHQMIRRAYAGLEQLWEYDRSGSRSRYQKSSPSTDTRDSVLPGHNRLIYSGKFTGTKQYTQFLYDANGARLREIPCTNSGCDSTNMDGNVKLYYDGMGRPVGRYEQVLNATWWTGAHCFHDAVGRQLFTCQQGDQVQLGYDGDNVVRTGHDTDNGSYAWTFIHGPGVDDPLFAKRGYSATPAHFYVTDGQGREYKVGARDGSAATTSLRGAKASGGTSDGTTFDPKRLESGEMPTISFFRNRWYDQATGRWTQEDPIGLAGGINLYQYAGNNPAVYTDPFGLCPIEKDGVPCLVVNAGQGLIAGAVGGAVVVGAAGTLAVPGGGTVVGAAGGAVAGGTAGLLAGAAVGAVRDVNSLSGAVVHAASRLTSKVKAWIVAGVIALGGGKTDIEVPPPPPVEQHDRPKKKDKKDEPPDQSTEGGP